MLTIAGVTVLLMGLMVLRRRRGVLQVAMLCVLYCICACSTKMGEAGVSILLKEKNYKTRYKRLEFCDVQFLSDLYQSDPTGPT